MHHRILSILVCGALSSAALQAQLVVPSVSYPTIQSAIDAAAPSNLITVLPGTYNENIDLKGKAITLMGVGGPASTIIDGSGAPVVKIVTTELRTTLVTGFTVRNGNNTTNNVSTPGGGFEIVGASPTIRNCWITGNNCTTYGGGIGGASTSSIPCQPLIEDCLFEGNTAIGQSYASGAGCGIFGPGNFAAGVPEIRRCTFRNNTATQRGGGLYFAYNQNAIVENCTFTGNQTNTSTIGLEGGAGIFMGLNSVCTVRNNVIWGNKSAGSGGGIKFFNVTGVTIVNNTIVDNLGGGLGGFANTGLFGVNVSANVTNCIMWNNGSPEVTFSGLDQQSKPPSANITYTDVTGGYAGTGNINANPLLANSLSGNVHLLNGSPCINAGDNSASGLPTLDYEGDPRIIGGTVDMGADERDPNSVVLYADRGTISLASPGTTNFTIAGGSGRAGYIYALLMSLSGTSPGLTIGSLHLPLNIDPATNLGLTVFPSFSGQLNGSGVANPTMPLGAGPLNPTWAGFELSFAAVIIAPGPVLNAFSNSETIRLVP